MTWKMKIKKKINRKLKFGIENFHYESKVWTNLMQLLSFQLSTLQIDTVVIKYKSKIYVIILQREPR